jgi:hypothetical protein
MKGITLVALVFFISFIDCKGSNESGFIYWEDLNKTQQESILFSPTIYKNAIKYYQGSLKIADNKATVELLDKITSDKNISQEMVFYFYIFNQICLESDGSLSEILGKYCMKYILINPKFVFSYFRRNKNIEKKYAELMGYEFYFKEEGTSDIEYTYKDFKKIIEAKIGKDQNYKSIWKEFCNEVENAMKNMD